MSYTDVDLIAASIKRELTSNERLTLSVLIPAIQKYVDKRCDTTFLEVIASTRVYDGGEETIDIDPCTFITAISLLDNYGVVNYVYNQNNLQEVIAQPVNSSVKNELVRRYGCFPHGDSRISVTAEFSSWDNGVPEDIIAVSTMLAVEGLRSTQVGTDNVKSESLEGHSVTYNDPSAMIATFGDSNPFVRGVFEYYRQPQVG